MFPSGQASVDFSDRRHDKTLPRVDTAYAIITETLRMLYVSTQTHLWFFVYVVCSIRDVCVVRDVFFGVRIKTSVVTVCQIRHRNSPQRSQGFSKIGFFSGRVKNIYSTGPRGGCPAQVPAA